MKIIRNASVNNSFEDDLNAENEYDYATQQNFDGLAHDHVYEEGMIDFGIADYAGPIDELPENIYINPQVDQEQTTDQQALYEVPPNASPQQMAEAINRLLQQNAELRKRFDNKQ